jgi:hypothetical protein
MVKFDLTELISKALKHVGFQCKGITKEVLFYIDINPNDWNDIWNIFAPSFQVLENQLNLKIHIFSTPPKNKISTKYNNSNDLDFESSFFADKRNKSRNRI